MTLTVARALEAMSGFPVVEASDFVRRGLVVVAPHPDDESLGCGGLIAACRAAGLPVAIVIVSDGAASHPNSRRYAPPRLAELREQEAIDAAVELRVAAADVHFLRLPDGAVPTGGHDAAKAVERIAELVGAADVMAVTWRHDPHCDHKASFGLARAAARRLSGVSLWEYPIWGLTLTPQTPLTAEPLTGVRVRVEDYLRAKRRAVAAHASQTTDLITDDPKGFRLTPSMLGLFDTPFEIFLKDAP